MCMENPNQRSPFEEWYRTKKRKIRQKLKTPSPWERFFTQNEISLDWLSNSPSVLLADFSLYKKSVNHLATLRTEHDTELLNCPVDHLPANQFPEHLGELLQIIVQLDDIRTITANEKVGGMVIAQSVLHAFFKVLVQFEKKNFITPLSVQEDEIVTVDEVEGLDFLAKDPANSKEKQIPFFHLKEIHTSSVLLGSPEDS